MDGQGYVKYLGIVQVPVVNLHFIAGVGERSYNQRQTERLEKLFRRTSVNHTDREHWIDGYIDGSVEASFLKDLNLTHSQLAEKNVRGEYPRVERHVAYTQGRHRIEAAKNIDLSSCWTIRIYCTDQDSFCTNRIVKFRTEQYQHELTNSDGEIYSKLREYDGDDVNFRRWYERLSVTKQKAFFYVTARPLIAKALDKLIHLRGVIEFLQLSTFLKIFDQRLDDELLAGLEHIHMQWSSFTSDNELRALDKDSVSALEGRAPAVSAADRNWIGSAFRDNRVFSSIADTRVRGEIEHRVLAAHGLIHSLRSLHMNMQHLCVAARIIWFYIIPKEHRKVAKAKKMSLSATLQSFWATEESYVEINEGVFQRAYGPPSFNMAYIQLMLSALRLFPHLTNTKPKVEKGEKCNLPVDIHSISTFNKRARLLGFHTLEFNREPVDPILHFGGSKWCAPYTMAATNEDELLARPDHRWGRPYNAIYSIIQMQAFLPDIKRLSEGSTLSVAFILRDFISVFFQPCHFELDYTRSPVRLGNDTTVQCTGKQSTGRSFSTVQSQPVTVATMTDSSDSGSLTAEVGLSASNSDVPMTDI